MGADVVLAASVVVIFDVHAGIMSEVILSVLADGITSAPISVLYFTPTTSVGQNMLIDGLTSDIWEYYVIDYASIFNNHIGPEAKINA